MLYIDELRAQGKDVDYCVHPHSKVRRGPPCYANSSWKACSFVSALRCIVQVASFCEWRLAQLQASGSINPTQTLKTARKALNRSAPAAVALGHRAPAATTVTHFDQVNCASVRC